MKRWMTALAMASLTTLTHAVEVGGVPVEETARIAPDAEPLVLNGAGVRKKFFFRVNVVALYLPAKSSAADEIVSMPGSKRVTLVMLRDVGAQQFIDAFNEGVQNNTAPDEAERLRPQRTQFESLMRELREVKKGDVVHLDYRPGVGTTLALNGHQKGKAIEGEAFYRALLRNWLGERPADEDLKRALTGG